MGQLGRKGDCLYATAVARQIKHDYPGCHLTWAISSLCRSVIDENPFIDAVWEVPQRSFNDNGETWKNFEIEAQQKKHNGEFDEIFLTQVPPNNFQNYDGTSRSSLLRGYPYPITVSVQPVVRLTEAEVASVKKFIVAHEILPSDTVVLIEAASTSGQSFMTPKYALEMVKYVQALNPHLKFILSSDKKIESENLHVIDGSVLSFRENAELTKYCTLLIGCSSGISWLATSDWAMKIPQIQILSGKTRMYASMLHDAKYYGLSTDNILELVDTSPQEAANIIFFALENGFQSARHRFQDVIPLKFDFYLSQIFNELLRKHQYQKAAQAISNALQRYRYDREGILELQRCLQQILFRFIHLIWNSLTRQEQDAFMAIGYTPVKNYSVLNMWSSLFQLCILSIAGDDYRLARVLALDRIKHFLGKEA